MFGTSNMSKSLLAWLGIHEAHAFDWIHVVVHVAVNEQKMLV